MVVQVLKPRYACEVCGRSYAAKWYAEACEREPVVAPLEVGAAYALRCGWNRWTGGEAWARPRLALSLDGRTVFDDVWLVVGVRQYRHGQRAALWSPAHMHGGERLIRHDCDTPDPSRGGMLNGLDPVARPALSDEQAERLATLVAHYAAAKNPRLAGLPTDARGDR